MSLAPEEKLARLERALAYGGHTHAVPDIVRLVQEKKAQWWESDNGDGMIVTEIQDYPLIRTVRYWLIFGSLKECLGLEDRINRWAMDEGCTLATAAGRKGWGRAAAPTGWKEWYPNFIKPLVQEH